MAKNSRVRKVSLICVEHEIGFGIADDPVRTLVELFTEEGALVAEWDTMHAAGKIHTPLDRLTPVT